VVSVGDDSFLRVWRVPTDNPDQATLSCVLAVDGTLNSLAWRPGSELLAVGGSHGLYVFQVAGPVGVTT
jgi:WD40 repeat protein